MGSVGWRESEFRQETRLQGNLRLGRHGAWRWWLNLMLFVVGDEDARRGWARQVGRALVQM